MYVNQVFTLSMVLDTNKFDRIFSNHNLLETDKEEYIDPSLTHKGIVVLYRNSQYKKKVSLIVNSAVMLKGKSLDAHKLIHKLRKRIGEYFGGRFDLEDFTLSESALVTDINVGSQDAVTAYIKVIQRISKVKGFSPPVMRASMRKVVSVWKETAMESAFFSMTFGLQWQMVSIISTFSKSEIPFSTIPAVF